MHTVDGMQKVQHWRPYDEVAPLELHVALTSVRGTGCHRVIPHVVDPATRDLTSMENPVHLRSTPK